MPGLGHHQNLPSPKPELASPKTPRQDCGITKNLNTNTSVPHQNWDIAGTTELHSSTGALPGPLPALQDPGTAKTSEAPHLDWHHPKLHGRTTASPVWGITKTSPNPTNQGQGTTKTFPSQTTTGITQFPCQDCGITRTFQLHPGRTGALPKLPQSHTRTLPKPPNPTHWDCDIIKTSRSQTRTGIINSSWQEHGTMKILPVLHWDITNPPSPKPGLASLNSYTRTGST